MRSSRGRMGTVGSVLGALLLVAVAEQAAAWDKRAPPIPPGGLFVPAAGRPGPVPVPHVSLVWFDVKGLVPDGFEPMAREVEAVFAEIGVGVDWRVGGLGTSYGEGDTAEFPVILLPSDPSASRSATHAMGLVMREATPPYPIWVFLSNVLWALGERAPTALAGGGERLARALGRVVAHEVVHAVSPGQPHAHDGIMRSALDRRALLGPRAALDAECARNFREALLVRSTSPPGASAGRAALGDR